MDRTKAPIINRIDKVSPFFPDKIILSNGIPLFLIQAPDLEAIRLDICFKIGSVHQHKKLAATMAAKMLLEGSTAFSSAQIAETFDYYGSYIDIAVEKELICIKLFTLPKFIGKLLPILEQIIYKPVFPENEFEKILNKAKQSYLVNIQKNNYLARLHFHRVLFPAPNPYGHMLDLDDFSAVSTDDVRMYYQLMCNASHTFAVICGNIEKSIKDDISYLLEQMPSASPVRLGSFFFQNERIQELVTKENSIQNAFRIGRILFNRHHQDFAVFSLVNTVLGGYFGSRLMQNIREKKGYTYSIYSMITPMKDFSIFSIASEVASEISDLAIAEVYHEIRSLQEHAIDETELQLVKNYKLGTMLRAFDGYFETAERIMELIELDLDFDYFTKQMDQIMMVTPAQIMESAQKNLRFEDLNELVVGIKKMPDVQ